MSILFGICVVMYVLVVFVWGFCASISFGIYFVIHVLCSFV